jgi:O-antigen ligase
MDLEQLDSWCEKGILGLVLAILVYTPIAFGGVPQAGFDYFVIVEWLTVLILAIWLVRFCVNPRHRLLWPPMCWAVLAFTGYAIWRYTTAEVEYLARQELLRVLVYAAIFFAVINNLHRQETTQLVGLTLIFLGMALALFAVFQFLTSYDYVWDVHKPDGYRKRGSGTFISPNNLAGCLGMILPLALTFTITGRMEALLKIFLGYASLAIFAGIAATISRAGWLAAGVSMGGLYVWLLRQRDFRRQSLIFLGVLSGIFLVCFWKAEMPPERYERFEIAHQVEDVRFRLWPAAVAIWKEHPWVGGGPAHFDYRFRKYRPADSELQARPDRAHNDYLNTLADWGIVGAALVLLCWGLFFYQVFSGWKYVQRSQNDLGAKRSNKAAFVAGGAFGLAAILVNCVFDFNMHIPANALIAVTLLSLVASHYRFASERYWHTVRWPLRIPVTLALLAALGYLGPQTWKHTRETIALTRAEKENPISPQRLAHLKSAWDADSRNFETAGAIGEALRLKSFEGGDGNQNLAKEAIGWFIRAAELNPFDPFSRLRHGMCLDWLGRTKEGTPLFEEAEKLDPNSYNTQAYFGWHYFQLEDYANARRRFERSLALLRDEKRNPIPFSYLKLISEKLKDSAGK